MLKFAYLLHLMWKAIFRFSAISLCCRYHKEFVGIHFLISLGTSFTLIIKHFALADNLQVSPNNILIFSFFPILKGGQEHTIHLLVSQYSLLRSYFLFTRSKTTEQNLQYLLKAKNQTTLFISILSSQEPLSVFCRDH